MTSKVLFTYIESTDTIEYGDFTVRTGIDSVQILASSGEILHNNTPIGGGGGSPSAPFIIAGSVVKCNIGVPGHPEENAQTIRVPLAPFILDAGEGAPTGSGALKLLTIEVIDDSEANLIFPVFTFTQRGAGVGETFTAHGDSFTGVSGTSLGRKSVDPITGRNMWTVLLNMGELYERYTRDSLVIGVIFDVSTETIDAIPIN